MSEVEVIDETNVLNFKNAVKNAAGLGFKVTQAFQVLPINGTLHYIVVMVKD